MSWFNIKITYDKEISMEGRMKKVSELYLVDAETFTDAEARITEIMSARGTFVIDSVRKVKYIELFLDDQSKLYYEAKVGIITLDERIGVERKKYMRMLVQADNLPAALDTLKDNMSRTLEDYEIASIKETMIVNIFKYERS